jgi:transglutaminase-like putative cysteine protease
MPILTIKHVTTYRYRNPVAFGEHRMMLRPRDDADQSVLKSEIKITPEPSELSWLRDDFGNHIAVASFADRAAELRFESTMLVGHAPGAFNAADIEDFAQTYPFVYAPEDLSYLAPFLTPPSSPSIVARWAKGFLRDDGSANTYALLTGMTQTIQRTFKHMTRHEQGIQEPAQTLALGTGSCRDVAVLMIEALRSLGIAARFVSGYLHIAGDDEDLTGGNTHAWVQAYIPGQGWIDFDPSSGIAGNENLVRVAVTHDPGGAIPLQGTWWGTASDHLAMQIAVKVIATVQ